MPPTRPIWVHCVTQFATTGCWKLTTRALLTSSRHGSLARSDSRFSTRSGFLRSGAKGLRASGTCELTALARFASLPGSSGMNAGGASQTAWLLKDAARFCIQVASRLSRALRRTNGSSGKTASEFGCGTAGAEARPQVSALLPTPITRPRPTGQGPENDWRRQVRT